MPLAIVVVALAVVALAVMAPKIAATNNRKEITDRCRNLQAQLAGSRTQGGDQGAAAQIEAQLGQCIADAQAAGEEIDTSLVSLEIARAGNVQLAQEWAHYKSTSYDDPVKRTNTRTTILRSGEDLVRRLHLAISQATSIASLDAIAELARQVATDSWARAACFDAGAAGCGRFAVNEPSWEDREIDEWVRVLIPIIGAVRVEGREPGSAGASLQWIDYGRPRWERLGLPPSHLPRLAYSIGPEHPQRFLSAGTAPVYDAIDKRRAELAPAPAARKPMTPEQTAALNDAITQAYAAQGGLLLRFNTK